MNIVYIRVSKVEQNEARQVEAMKQYNIDKVYQEKVSAKNTHRPKLQEMLVCKRRRYNLCCRLLKISTLH